MFVEHKALKNFILNMDQGICIIQTTRLEKVPVLSNTLKSQQFPHPSSKPSALCHALNFRFLMRNSNINQRRQWHPTPVLLPGKSHGQKSLVGCGPWGREESDTTQQLPFSLFTFMHWRRKWQSTPVFLPGESQGRGSLVGCRLWDRIESDTTEVT